MLFRFCLFVFIIALSVPNIALADTNTNNTSENIEPEWTLEVIGIKQFASGEINLPEVSRIMSFSHGIYSAQTYGYSSEPKPEDSEDSDEVIFNDFCIVKYVDALTPYFFKAVLEKKVFSKIILNLKQGDILMRYELYNAVITTVRPGGSAYSSEVPMEEVVFCFEKIRILYEDKYSKGEVELKNK